MLAHWPRSCLYNCILYHSPKFSCMSLMVQTETWPLARSWKLYSLRKGEKKQRPQRWELLTRTMISRLWGVVIPRGRFEDLTLKPFKTQRVKAPRNRITPGGPQRNQLPGNEEQPVFGYKESKATSTSFVTKTPWACQDNLEVLTDLKCNSTVIGCWQLEGTYWGDIYGILLAASFY